MLVGQFDTAMAVAMAVATAVAMAVAMPMATAEGEYVTGYHLCRRLLQDSMVG